MCQTFFLVSALFGSFHTAVPFSVNSLILKIAVVSIKVHRLRHSMCYVSNLPIHSQLNTCFTRSTMFLQNSLNHVAVS